MELKEHLTYSIQQGDTLSSISRKLSVSSIELIAYHNDHCDRSQRLVNNKIPPDVKQLFIPSHAGRTTGTVLKKVRQEKVSLGTGNRLHFNPRENPVAYGVLLELTQGAVKHTIKYEAGVHLIGTNRKGAVFEITRLTKTYINDEEANDIADELAVKTAAVLYPLHIQTDGNGNYSGIANHPAIQKRSAEQKEKLLTEYTGEVMERYLYECEQTIMDQTLTEKVMLNDLFIKALFANGIYTRYNSDYTGKSTIAFPVLPHKMPVAYAIDLKLDKYLNADGLAYIEQQGKACDERSAADLEAGLPVASSDEKVAGDFVAKYFLEPVSNQMIALYQKCSLSLNQERVVMSSINKIERTISS